MSGDPKRVTAIEVLEDVTRSTPPDEGFLHLKRLRARNVRADGSTSAPYRIDMVERPTLDAVAVLLYRRGEGGELEVLTRKNLRPAAYFRAGKATALGTDTGMLEVEEIVAGVLEKDDRGEAGILARAREEAREEAGIVLDVAQVKPLGGPFFVAPGIISEQIHLAAADCTGAPEVTPEGDGTPLEEGGELRWWPARALLAACREGRVRDAKTELALSRLLFPLG